MARKKTIPCPQCDGGKERARGACETCQDEGRVMLSDTVYDKTVVLMAATALFYKMLVTRRGPAQGAFEEIVKGAMYAKNIFLTPRATLEVSERVSAFFLHELPKESND